MTDLAQVFGSGKGLKVFGIFYHSFWQSLTPDVT